MPSAVSRAGRSDPTVRMAPFYFWGPPCGQDGIMQGAGRFLFDSEDHLIRLDMSSYGKQFCRTTDRGASGYVGYEEALSHRAVRRKPYP